MSYQYSVTERRRRTTGGGPSGSSYGHSGNRSAFGYWVPLVLTVGAAAVGVAAWIWSERREDDEDSSNEEHYPGGVPPPGYASMSGGVGIQGGMPPGGPMPPGPGPQGMVGPEGGPMWQGGPPPPGQEPGGYEAGRSMGIDQQQDTGIVARMSSALGMGRSASPAQSYNWASTKVAAGVAAASAMVGGAMKTLGGSGQGEFEDHERWSEEADQRDTDRDIKRGIRRQGTADEFFSGAVGMPRSASMQFRKRRSVAVVVSAIEDSSSGMDLGHHASILAHLPEHVEPDTTRVFVLIYAPELRTHPLSSTATRRPTQSMASSFSNISETDVHTPAHTPGEFPDGEGMLSNVDPNPLDDASSLYKTLHNQAQALVERDAMILPFTSKNGHKHMLKSLAPEVVYIQESLCGSEGEVVADLSGWVRQTVVVIGDEGGQGGLIDTDDESARTGSKQGRTWWQREERTGLGKRVAVVESLKVGDDWDRRINERD